MLTLDTSDVSTMRPARPVRRNTAGGSHAHPAQTLLAQRAGVTPLLRTSPAAVAVGVHKQLLASEHACRAGSVVRAALRAKALTKAAQPPSTRARVCVGLARRSLAAQGEVRCAPSSAAPRVLVRSVTQAFVLGRDVFLFLRVRREGVSPCWPRERSAERGRTPTVHGSSCQAPGARSGIQRECLRVPSAKLAHSRASGGCARTLPHTLAPRRECAAGPAR